MVGAGSFNENIEIAEDLTLRGLCPGMTTLTRSRVTDPETGVVNVSGGNVTVQDLRIGDTGAVGLVASGATVSLSGVVIDGVTNHGISSISTTLADVLVENIAPRASDTLNGDAIYSYGGTLVGERVGMSNAYRVGLWSEAGSFDLSDVVAFDIQSEEGTGQRGGAIRHYSGLDGVLRRFASDHTQSYSIVLTTGSGNLAVEDAWVTDTVEQTAGDAFGGIGSGGTGTLTISGAVIQDVVAYGVASAADTFAVGPVIVEDVVIRRVTRAPYRTPDFYGNGAGMKAVNSPEFSAARVVIEDTEGDGVNLGLSEYTAVTGATLADLVLRRNGAWLGYSGSTSGGGGLVNYGAVTTLDRAIIEDEPRAGVFLDVGAGSLVANDVYIGGSGSDVSVLTNPGLGVGSGFASGGSVAFTRLLVDNAHTYGIDMVDTLSASFEDVVVRDTQPHSLLGLGLPVRLYGWDGAPVSLHRVAISGGTGAGVWAQLVTADLQDVSISGIGSLMADGRGGFGVSSKYADVTIARAAVTDVQYGGIWANGGSLALQDLLVSGVTAQDCAADASAGDSAATGIFVGADPANEVTASLTQVLVEGAGGVGLQVGAGTATATDVLLRNNAVGLDGVGGVVTSTRLSFDGDTVDNATEAQLAPTPPWTTVVANDNAVGVDLGEPLVAGVYTPVNLRDLKNDCTTLTVYYYPTASDLSWQGTSEFTLASAAGDAVPACVYDGEAINCTTTADTLTVDPATRVTISVERSDFAVMSGASFNMVETMTYTCEGDSCDGYPCSWSMRESGTQ